MRILLINYRYFVSGGPERYLFNVKTAFEAAGHQVIPFSVKSKKNVSTEFEANFADPLGGQDEAYFDNAKRTPRFVVDLLSRLFYSFHVKRKLTRLIEKTRPDVAYILHHYNKLSPSVIDACKNKGLKVYVRLSDFFLLCPQAHFLRQGRICERCLKHGLREAVKGRCVKNSVAGSALKAAALYFHTKLLKTYKRVDGFVCTTQFMKNMMLRAGWSGERLHVIPTFIPKMLVQSFDRSKRLPSKKTILYFGRFANEKGLDLLVSAFGASGLADQEVRLALVGGSKVDLEIAIGKKIDELEVKGNMDIYEFKESSALNELIEDSMFVVVPSRWYENMPNAVLESYALGKPVVASDIGSMPEVIEDGVSGLLFSSENTADLASKLRALSLNSALLGHLTRGVGLVRKRFDQDEHTNQLIGLLSGK